MIRIEPYRIFSGGARALAKRAGILRTTRKQVAKHRGNFATIINWGNSERRFPNATYINAPESVTIASDKIQASEAFRQAGTPHPEFTTSQEEAQGWIERGDYVCARTLTRGSGGRGISIHGPAPEMGDDSGDTSGGGIAGRTDAGRPLVRAPLYTKYEKKAEEYRVHIFDREIIDVQQKRKRQEVPNEEVDYQIRNADNGWVYCRGGVDAPQRVIRAALSAMAALDLDFGAVDVGYNVKHDTAMVYEVNTAPGLEGRTLDNYYRALVNRLPALRGGAYARRRSVA